VSFDILTAMTMKIIVFCNVTPCSLMNRYQHLKETADSISSTLKMEAAGFS
jgi:hypothetical protein